jgi:hypothetical protein
VGYLGAIETSTNGMYDWSDGTPWDYTAPMNDGLSSSETRIIMNSDFKWHDSGTGGTVVPAICRLEAPAPGACSALGGTVVARN